MKKFYFLLVLTPFLLFGSDYSDARNLNLSADGIDQLKVDCGSGFLKLSGKPGLKSILVKAEITSQHESEARIKKLVEDYMVLTLEQHGSTAKLTSKFESVHSFFGGHGDVQINLTVEVPEKMDLDIHDGSGSILIKDITGRLKLDDGSGETEIDNITGDVDVEDGSGSLKITQINGNLEVDDGSGEIDIRQITGNVEIEDGSGSIDVDDVTGDVDVDDGSGSIDIRNVGKDVIIRESGSGGVSISDVRGKIYRHDKD